MVLVRRHRALLLSALTAIVTALSSAGLLTAAILVPAPSTVLVPIIAVCIAMPMAAAWDLSRVTAAIGPRHDPHELRLQLDRPPETPHPLDL